MYIFGKANNASYPKSLQLYGRDLPWVKNAVHLGHEFHQDGTMEHDTNVKRAQFIEKSIEVREMFSFAYPDQILKAIDTYAAHFYGSMLWDLYGNGANKVFRTWNTCVKLSWKIPRWTHNYFVEHLLTPKLSSIRKRTLCQYLGFFRKLLQSSSPEIQLLANTVGRDSGSVTAANLRNIEHEFGKDPWVTTATGLSTSYM